MSKPHIAIVMGGISSERPVSLISGSYCADTLRDAGYKVTCIDVTNDIAKFVDTLNTKKPDVVLNMLHGTYGEDGRIQGLLELLNIPYSHSGVLASALAMDKQKTKDILSLHGIPCPNSILLTQKEYKNCANKIAIPTPYILKPNSQGSSFGVCLIKNAEEEKSSKNKDIWMDNTEMLIEEYIAGRELTVAVIDNKAIVVTEIIPDPKTGNDFYDYTAKYAEGGSIHIIPANIPKDIYNDAMDYALKAHQVLGCTGVTRADFRYNDTDIDPKGLYFLEINTQPGMTPTSLVPEQAEYIGMSFTELVIWMAENPINKKSQQKIKNAPTEEKNSKKTA